MHRARSISPLRRFCLGVAVTALAPGAGAGALFTERVSVNPATGAQADGNSNSPAVSADGCIVAFVSQSGTLANASFGLTKTSPAQVYAVNRCVTPHTLELVSVTDDGTAAADQPCMYPNVSSDGRYVSFLTTAGNLPVPGSGPPNRGLFVFIRDRQMQTTASPLEAWRVTANTSASVSTNNPPRRYLSGDASRLAFEFFNSVSVPSNLYLFDRSGGATTMQALCPSAAETGAVACTESRISADGGTVAFDTDYPITAGDSNGVADVFAYAAGSGTSALISVNGDGSQANGSVDPYGDIDVSSDGRFVVFSSSEATNFPGATTNTLLLKDRQTGALSLVSVAGDGSPGQIEIGSALPQVSDDGSRVAFNAENSLLPNGVTTTFLTTFVFDRTAARLANVCQSSSGSIGNERCDSVALSADGHWAAYASIATNLVPGDTNDLNDVFVTAVGPAIDDVFASGFEK